TSTSGPRFAPGAYFLHFLSLPHPPLPTLFPYTTLFRSLHRAGQRLPAPGTHRAVVGAHLDEQLDRRTHPRQQRTARQQPPQRLERGDHEVVAFAGVDRKSVV